MKRKTACFSIATLALLALAALAVLVPPFLLPDRAYDALYGWRYPKTWTCGAATIVDAGPSAAADRFVANLGPLSLATSGTHQYRLCQLPEAELAVVLLLPWRTPPHVQNLLRGTDITATLTDSSGSLLSTHSGSIVGGWTWSGPYSGQAFVYGTLAFDADPTMQYDLELDVQNAGNGVYPAATVTVQGGGWK